MLPRLWLLVGSDRPTDRQCHLLSCPGQLKNKKRKKKLPPISCLPSSSRSSVWVKMKGGTMQKVRWVVCRTFTAPHHCLRTNCCAKLDPLLKSSNGNVLCVCVTNVESKLLYCDVQSGFRAKCAHCLSYSIRLKCSILYKESLWKFCV